jgi:hypothetical protein
MASSRWVDFWFVGWAEDIHGKQGKEKIKKPIVSFPCFPQISSAFVLGLGRIEPSEIWQGSALGSALVGWRFRDELVFWFVGWAEGRGSETRAGSAAWDFLEGSGVVHPTSQKRDVGHPAAWGCGRGVIPCGDAVDAEAEDVCGVAGDGVWGVAGGDSGAGGAA